MLYCFFFFNDTATTEIYTLSLHDALPIYRVVVMKDGRIQQVGSPNEVYSHPTNMFVAGFVGSPAMNFLPGRLVTEESHLLLEMDGFQLRFPRERSSKLMEHVGKKVIAGIRPEEISDRPPTADDGANYERAPARVEIIEPLGPEVILGLTLGGVRVRARVKTDTKARVLENIETFLNMDKLHLFDVETEETIR